MNKQTEQNINEAVDWLQGTANNLQSFAAEQAPLYCQELLEYYWVQSIVGMVICGLLSLAMVALIRKIKRVCAEECCDNADRFVAYALPVLVGAVSTLLFCIALLDAVKIKVAPRVVIMEHFRELCNYTQ